MKRTSLVSFLLLTACPDQPVATAGTGDALTSGSSGVSIPTTDAGSTSAAGTSTTGATASTGSTTGASTLASTSGADSTGDAGTSTGGAELTCWAKRCDDGSPCADGLICEQHPDTADVWVCTAPCVQVGPGPDCVTEPYACGENVPLGVCQVGADEALRCFPVLCPGNACQRGAQCVDGYCFE